MSSVGAFKSLCACIALVVSCSAQTVNSASAASSAGAGANGPAADVQADVRPAIIQRSTQSAQIVAAGGAPGGQLSSASFHIASDEEITGMEQTLEQYVIAFKSLELAQIQKVWPDLDRQHTKVFKSAFATFKSSSANPRLGLQCAVPRVTADTANLDCTEIVTYTVGKGKHKQAGPARILIQLKGQSAHWVLADMKGVG
jgi:hypothetical protein